MRRIAAVAAAVALVTGAACTSSGEHGSRGNGSPNGPGAAPVAQPNLELIAALEPFDSCDAILNHLKSEARQRVTAYGLPGHGGGIPVPVMTAEDATATRGAAPAPGAPTTTAADLGSPTSAEPDAKAGQTGSGTHAADKPPSPEFSETNVQEEGVDEPDLLRTDGKHLYTLLNGQLTVFEVRDGTPAKVGELRLPDAAMASRDLLLSGDRLLALGQTYDVLPMEKPSARAPNPGGASIAPVPRAPSSVLTQIDVSDRGAPRVTGSIVIDGAYVNARLVDGVARIVIESEPSAFAFVYPSNPGNKRSEEIALEANRRIIDESTIEDWLPGYTVGSSRDRDRSQPLLDCARVSHPKQFSGLGMLSIITVDLQQGLDPGGAVGILAHGDRVYASKHNLYVSTTHYTDPTDDETGEGARTTVPRTPEQVTAIHKFDLSGTGAAVYRASGAVAGEILNDFAMSEYENHLRVATTERVGGRTGSESLVTVLRETDGELTQVGQVGGLGKGEQIKAVRFIGRIGYVVTFRQTDPLYTVDLADPAAPRVRGELKVLGYSAYLHPVSETRLLGVGQDATDPGHTLGTQIALYDVADPANPRELQKLTLPGGQSNIEQDYHAFLWWAKTKLALVPVQSYGYSDVICPAGAQCEPGLTSSFVGVIGYTVDEAGIRELGRIVNPYRYGGPPSPCPTGADCAPGAEPGGGGDVDCEVAGACDPVPPTTIACPPDALCVPPSPSPIPPPVVGDPILRSAVIGDTVFTVSNGGVQASDLATLDDRVFVPFR